MTVTATATTTSTTFDESACARISGSIGLSAADPDAFIADPATAAAMKDMLANLLGTDPVFLQVKLVKAALRRLRLSVERRLQGGNVDLQYTVLVPAGASNSPSVDSIANKLTNLQPSEIATHCEAALETYTGNRFQVAVTALSTPAVALATVTSTTRTTSSTVTKFRTVTRTTSATSTVTSTTRTTTSVTTSTIARGAPTATSTTSSTTVTAPPPPAQVAAPPPPCTDVSSFRDATGLSCQDWTGLNCSAGGNASSYTEDALAAVRKNCPVACGFCAVAAPFVVKAAKKVASALTLQLDLTQLDQDTREMALRSCFASALGVPYNNVINVQIVDEDTSDSASRRLQGGAPTYKVKYEVVVPASKQVRDILLQATSLSVSGSGAQTAFSQVMSDGYGVDTSALAVQLPAPPVASPISVILQGDEVVAAAPSPPPPSPQPGAGSAASPSPPPSASGGGGAASGGGSSSTPIVAASCADEGGFVDEQGDPCSAWIGLDCADPKWLRTERPYTLKGLRKVQESCPLACGLCQPPSRQPPSELTSLCIDDPPIAAWCARWRGLSCSAAADLGYGPTYMSLLLDRCPQSCGMCQLSAAACVDAAAFVDEQGGSCSTWRGLDCTKRYSGYTRKGMLEVQAACPASCGRCGLQASAPALMPTVEKCEDDADYSYLQQFMCRDFIGRRCTYATLYLEPRWLLGPQAVSDWHRRLWSACPVACGRCNPRGRPTPEDLFIECEDDHYVAEWCAAKWKNQDCTQWQKAVRLVLDGEAQAYNETLLGRCPETCGRCVKPSCSAGTYRDKVAHACVPCQPGRYAREARAGREAQECAPSQPGFSVPEAGATQEVPCDAGTFTSAAGQTECKLCPAGYYGASRGMSACIACSAGWHQDAEGATECRRCLEGSYAESNASSVCERCPLDYTTLLQASTGIQDCVCPVGTYKPYNATGGCVACPQGISCPGGHAYVNTSFDGTPMLMVGAMSLPEDPFSAYLCTAPDACLEERPLPYNEEAMDGVCPSLTSGARCWDCEDNGVGAYHDADNQCQPCGTVGIKVLKIFAFFVFQLLYTQNLYRQEGSVQSGAKLMFLAVLGFMQVLTALTQIPLNWPPTMSWFLTFLVYFGYEGFLSDLLDFRQECFFGRGLLPKVLRDVTFPLLPFLNFAIIGAVNRMLHRKMAWGAAQNVIATMYLSLFVSIAAMALQLFPGEDMPNGKVYLVAFPGVEVGSKEWKQGVPVSILAISTFCVGFLAYCLHTVLVVRSKMDDEDWMEARDWMVGEVNPATHWWPVVDLFYAFAITALQAISPNIYFDIYLEMGVLLVYTMMVLYYQPCTYGAVNSTSAVLNVGLLIFMAFSTGFVNTALVDQTPNRRSFGVIMVILLWSILAYVLYKVCHAIFVRCTTNPMHENIRQAHRARIMMQALILLPEAQFVGALGPEKLFDPDLRILEAANRLLVSCFLHMQPGPRLHQQRIMKRKEFKVFEAQRCRAEAWSMDGKVLALRTFEDAARMTSLANTLTERVLRNTRNSVASGSSQESAPPGPIISHASCRLSARRWSNPLLWNMLPEVPAAHMDIVQPGDPAASPQLASLPNVRRSVVERARGVLHEGGAVLVDEDAFVRELREVAGMAEGELREVFRHLDLSQQGQLKASHVVSSLLLFGGVAVQQVWGGQEAREAIELHPSDDELIPDEFYHRACVRKAGHKNLLLDRSHETELGKSVGSDEWQSTESGGQDVWTIEWDIDGEVHAGKTPHHGWVEA